MRRKDALVKSGKQRKSNVAVMKPFFTKPKLQTTVPVTPEIIRRMRVFRKPPPKGYKSFKDRENEEVDEMKKYKFVANPIPKSVKGTKEVPSRVKSSKAVTKPVSPKISKTKKRKFDEVEQPIKFKARPIPNYDKPQNHKRAQKKTTIVKPFAFDKRYADPNMKKKEMIAEALEKCKKQTKFKATPYFGSQNENIKPNVNKSGRKDRKNNVSSFELPGEAISKKKREVFELKVKKEEEERKQKRKFTATIRQMK